MPDKGWQRSFDDPIPLPRGRQLVTLRDAALYITKLPRAEHDATEWQAAMEALKPLSAARVGRVGAFRVRVFDGGPLNGLIFNSQCSSGSRSSVRPNVAKFSAFCDQI
jgi:hypothetical protein